MKLSVFILDDNINDINSIKKVILNYQNTKDDVFFEVQSYTTYSDLILDNKYDLYIIDIELPYSSGFEISLKIQQNTITPNIIFCSKHDNLVFDSFQLNPFYFVRKSSLTHDLYKALDKFIINITNNPQYYIFKKQNFTLKIPYSEIMYFEVLRNDLFIHTLNKEYSERKSMKKLLRIIPKNLFVQCNQNHLANIKYISDIKNNNILLKNGIIFKISRQNINDVKKQYLERVDF